MLVQVLRIFPFEWKAATEHGIEKDAGGPDVGRRSLVVTSLHNLRCHVRWRATENLKLCLWRRAATESKVYELDHLLAVNDNVLQLNVSMCDVSVVQVFQSKEELLDDSFGFLLSKLPISLRFQMRVQTLTVGVLHHQVNVLGCVNAFVQLDDIGMVQSREDFYFTNRLLFALHVQ